MESSKRAKDRVFSKITILQLSSQQRKYRNYHILNVCMEFLCISICIHHIIYHVIPSISYHHSPHSKYLEGKISSLSSTSSSRHVSNRRSFLVTSSLRLIAITARPEVAKASLFHSLFPDSYIWSNKYTIIRAGTTEKEESNVLESNPLFLTNRVEGNIMSKAYAPSSRSWQPSRLLVSTMDIREGSWS